MFAERVLHRLVRFGGVEVVLPDGREIAASGHDRPRFRIRFWSWTDLFRLPFQPTLAFAEAYMAGRLTVENGSLHELVDFLYANQVDAEATGPARLLRKIIFPVRRFWQHNTAFRARRNVKHHYDIPGEIYELFLDSDRQYSCAYFPREDMTLDEAQEAKKRRIASKLQLQEHQQVLDIGSGWGGLALHLAKFHGVAVKGLTLSSNQFEIASKRAADDGLSKQVSFELGDYRNESGRFDRIVSVGMFEHVGLSYYRSFFETIRRCLVDDGIALLHTIGRSAGPGVTDPFIRRYIFPGGYIPALSEVLPVIERTGLQVTDVEVLRLHYAYTLSHWRQRVLAARDKVLEIADERFLRMWELYLSGSEAAFRHGGMVVFQIQMAKKVDALPLSRNYMSN